MHTFTLKDVRKLGERDEKYGQSYWGYTHESQMPVKFNSMSDDVPGNAKISCEEYTVRKSNKGTEYQQLRKVKIEGASTDAPAQSSNSQLDRIEAMLVQLTGGAKKEAPVAETTTDEVHEDEDEEEPINLDDIPF